MKLSCPQAKAEGSGGGEMRSESEGDREYENDNQDVQYRMNDDSGKASCLRSSGKDGE